MVKSMKKLNFDTLIYSFNDASIPPEYHRSYTLTLSKQTVHLIVDSYGNIVDKKQWDTPNSVFEKLQEKVNSNPIDQCQHHNPQSFTGGTSQTITLYKNNQQVVKAYLYEGYNLRSLKLHCKNFYVIAKEINTLKDSLIEGSR